VYSAAALVPKNLGVRLIWEMKSCGPALSLCAALPKILEASAEGAAAQSDDSVGTADRPMHARPFESGSDYNFAPRLHHPRRSAETLSVKFWISHPAAIIPDVTNTVPCLGILAQVAA
jgi:hypothetical protein